MSNTCLDSSFLYTLRWSTWSLHQVLMNLQTTHTNDFKLWILHVDCQSEKVLMIVQTVFHIWSFDKSQNLTSFFLALQQKASFCSETYDSRIVMHSRSYGYFESPEIEHVFGNTYPYLCTHVEITSFDIHIWPTDVQGWHWTLEHIALGLEILSWPRITCKLFRVLCYLPLTVFNASNQPNVAWLVTPYVAHRLAMIALDTRACTSTPIIGTTIIWKFARISSLSACDFYQDM